MENQIEIVKYKFFSTVVADIIKAIEGGSLTGAYTLAFCCIDYLGLALNPTKKNTKADFLKYTNDYLGRINKKYIKYAEHLYAIRCSLVHSFGPSNATENLDFVPFLMFYDEHENFGFHFYFEQDTKKLYISLHKLISELIASIFLFFIEQKDSNLFVIWEGKLFYDNSLIESIKRRDVYKSGVFTFEKIHKTLELLDKSNDLSEIKMDINMKLKEKIKPFIPTLKFKNGYIDNN